MAWIKSNAALLTLLGVALIAFIIVRQNGGLKKALSNAGTPAQPDSAATA